MSEDQIKKLIAMAHDNEPLRQEMIRQTALELIERYIEAEARVKALEEAIAQFGDTDPQGREWIERWAQEAQTRHEFLIKARAT